MSGQNTELYVYNCTNYLDCQPFRRDLLPGRYKLEAWGAQGGNVTYNGALYEGGKGGYVSGELDLTQKTTLFIFCGEMGTTEKGTHHSYSGYTQYETRNTFGGGGRGNGYEGTNFYPSSGGGMSFISIGEAKNESGILFAGAGSGSGAGSAYNGYGGYGGGVSGGSGSHCFNNDQSYCGTGATQTSPGTNSQNSLRNGGKFYGGNCGQDNGWSTGGGSGYYGGAGGNRYGTAGGGGSSFFDTSFIKNGKTIPGNEEMPSPFSLTEKITGNRGHGYVRITTFGYFLYQDSQLLDFYKPGSTLTLDLHINSLGVGENAKISLKLQDSPEKVIYSHDDTGEEYHFSHSIQLPQTSGYYTFTFYVTSRTGIKNSKSFTVLVNTIPQVKVLNEIKPKYKVGEEAKLEVEIFDDTKARLLITENGYFLFNESFDINNTPKAVNCSFTPPWPASDEVHFVMIKAVDEFNFSSKSVFLQYEITDRSSPNLRLDDNFSFYFKSGEMVQINSSVEDIERKYVCMYTLLNDRYQQKHSCLTITEQIWNPFQFNRILIGFSDGIYQFSIFCMDDDGMVSNKINRQIAIISETFIVCSKTITIRREIILTTFNVLCI